MADTSTKAPGRGRVARRWLIHVVLVASWVLIALMALLTWGPHLTRYKTEIIIGQSMEPTIPLWSVIVVKPVKPSAIDKGDIIVAQPPMLDGRKVTHQVVDIDNSNSKGPIFITKGDNNETTDPWTVGYEDRGWVVVKHVPHVGWIMAKAQSRIARVLLIVLPVVLILTQLLRWIWRDERAEVAETPTAATQWSYFDDTPPVPELVEDVLVEDDQLEIVGMDVADPIAVLEEPLEESNDEPALDSEPARIPTDAPVVAARAVAAERRSSAATTNPSTGARILVVAVPLLLVALGARSRRRSSRGSRRR